VGGYFLLLITCNRPLSQRLTPNERKRLGIDSQPNIRKKFGLVWTLSIVSRRLQRPGVNSIPPSAPYSFLYLILGAEVSNHISFLLTFTFWGPLLNIYFPIGSPQKIRRRKI